MNRLVFRRLNQSSAGPCRAPLREETGGTSACYIASIDTAAAQRVTIEALAADRLDTVDLCATVGLEARHMPPRDITSFQLAFVLPELIVDPSLRDTPVALAGFGLPAHFGDHHNLLKG